MRQLILASWRAHRRRTLATFVAVAIGVCFCATVLALTAAARQGAGDAVASEYRSADVVAYPTPGQASAALGRIDRLPTVAAASVVSSASLGVRVDTPSAIGQVFSEVVSEIAADPTLRWQQLARGSLPSRVDQVSVDAAVASAWGVSVGDRLTIGPGTSRALTVTVVGIVTHPAGAADLPGLLTAPHALADWRPSGVEAQILVKARDGVSPGLLAAQVQRLVPHGGVETADEIRSQALQNMTDNVDVIGKFLLAFAAIALLVAGLVASNTLRIVMTQRARDLALLRCVGAQRGQVLLLVTGEAVVVGVLASLAGLVAGWVLAASIVPIAAHLDSSLPLAISWPTGPELAVPLVGGLLVTVLGSLGPGLLATRLPPIAALQPAALEGQSDRSGFPGLRVAWGFSCWLLGGLALAAAVRSGRVEVGLAGGALSFVGVLCVLPLVVPTLIRAGTASRALLPRRWSGGVPVRLAGLEAVRHPRRTAAAAAALLVGVTLISTLSVGAASVQATETQALNRVTPVDFVVSGADSGADSGAVGATPAVVPTDVLRRIRSIPGVVGVAELDGVAARVDGVSLPVAALSPGQAASVVRDPALRAQIGRAGIAVVPASVTAAHPALAADQLTLTALTAHAGSPADAGTQGSIGGLSAVGSSLSDGPIVVPAHVLAQLGGTPRPIAVYVRVADDADPTALQTSLQGALHDRALGVSGGFEKRSTYNQLISVLWAVSAALVSVAVLIALVGVGNTLSLSILERGREHGILRAVGLTRRQLVRLLVNEGALLAGAAALLGVAAGIGYGFLGTETLLHGTVSSGPALVIPWVKLGLVVAVTLLAGAAAALLPARRAAAIRPADAVTDG